MTDYDRVAASGHYEQRYSGQRYQAVWAQIERFAQGRVLELGCGTGHWLRQLRGRVVLGIDPSEGMLAQCKDPCVRARAEALPLAEASFDRVLIVNALHHFADPEVALREVARVLRPGGAILTIGLDPSRHGRWPVYEYFEGTLERDRARFASASSIRAWLTQAGFLEVRTDVAETFAERTPAREALGRLAKHTTSQLSELSDEDYARGIARIEALGDAMLETELTLYATHASLRC